MSYRVYTAHRQGNYLKFNPLSFPFNYDIKKWNMQTNKDNEPDFNQMNQKSIATMSDSGLKNDENG